jgi:hypothetical protein
LWYLPFEEDLALDLYNFIFPLPKNDLYQVWFKLACWFWRRRFLKIFSEFLLFRYYLPLGKGVVLHLYNSEFPLPKEDLFQVRLKLAQQFWRRSWKCKSLTDRPPTLQNYEWDYVGIEYNYIMWYFQNIDSVPHMCLRENMYVYPPKLTTFNNL